MNKVIRKKDNAGQQVQQNCHEKLQYEIVFGNQQDAKRDFGDPKGYGGIYVTTAFLESEMFEIDRGSSATGIRGIIDPFDSQNPYRIQSITDLDEKAQLKVKNQSWVTQSTAAAS